jgi:trimethylamine monooxygenase
MQNIAFSLTLFDVQACFVRDVILNRIVLPDDQQERAKDMTKWLDREKFLMENTKHFDDAVFQELLIFQSQYLADLQSAIDSYPILNLDAVLIIFQQFIRHRKENMATYRQHQFVSTITGSMSTLANK